MPTEVFVFLLLSLFSFLSIPCLIWAFMSHELMLNEMYDISDIQ